MSKSITVKNTAAEIRAAIEELGAKAPTGKRVRKADLMLALHAARKEHADRVLGEPAAKPEPKKAAQRKGKAALPALEVRLGKRAISVVQGGSWVAWVKVGTDISGEGRTGRSRVNFGTDGSWIAAGRVEEIRGAITAALAAAESTAA